MKKHLSILVALVFFSTALFTGCSDHGSSERTSGSVTVIDEGAKGLDLQALGELAKKSKDAQTLENELNKENSINNLDLDGDGKVDYISVTEYGDDQNKGLSLTTQIKNAETNKVDTQEVATIQFSKNTDNTGNMQIAGNQNVYGNNANYHSSFNSGDMLLMMYLFSYHPFYRSPFYYGYYPAYYHPYSRVPAGAYAARTSTYTKSTTVHRTPATSTNTQRSTIKSPNSSRNSSFVANHSLNSPTKSQKSFQVRDQNKSVGSGGFGSRSKSSSSSSSSFSRPPSSSKSCASSRRAVGSGSSSSGRRKSDLRLKHDVVTMVPQLENLCKLTPVTFYYNDKVDSNQHVGFIAQNVETVYPQVVHTDSKGMKSVDYDYLVAPAIESIKELKAENDHLKMEVHHLDSIVHVLMQNSNSFTVKK